MSSDEESEIDNANEIIQEEPYVKPKRKMSPEHLAKLAEGRVKSLEIRSKKGNELKKIKQEKLKIKEALAAKEAEELARAAALLSIDEPASRSPLEEEEPVKIKKKKKKPTVIFESDDSDDDNDRVIYVRRREKKVMPQPPPIQRQQPLPPPTQPPPPPPPPRSYLPKRPAYFNHYANY